MSCNEKPPSIFDASIEGCPSENSQWLLYSRVWQGCPACTKNSSDVFLTSTSSHFTTVRAISEVWGWQIAGCFDDAVGRNSFYMPNSLIRMRSGPINILSWDFCKCELVFRQTSLLPDARLESYFVTTLQLVRKNAASGVQKLSLMSKRC